jgi:putative ABC transport system ATP-binding protein
MLRAEGLHKEYRDGRRICHAVRGAGLSVAAGDLVCITGRSGSGKSTLLNMLAGLLRPTAGRIYFAGEDCAGLNDRALSRLRATRLGYVMQGPSLLPNCTVLQNVLVPAVLWPDGRDRTERALRLLEQMGLAALAQRFPSALSGGEARRAAIARALLSEPDLLLADEPTGDLDGETTAEIMDIFTDIARAGAAVLMVTHDRDAAARAGRRLEMREGELLAERGR